MDGNINACLFLKFIQDVGNLLNRLIMPGVCAAHDHEYPNGVLVDILPHQIRIKPVMTLLRDRQDPSLHVKVPGKLL